MKLYRRKNKFYYVRHGDRKMSLGTKDSSTARKKYAAIKKQWEDAGVIKLDSSRMTLGLFRNEYDAHRKPPRVKPETYRRDMQVLKSLANSVGDSCRLPHITAKKIALWQRDLLDKEVKARTINSYGRHLLKALRTAAEWGYLAKVPKVERLQEPPAEDRGLTRAQVDHLLKTETNPELRRIWRFVVFTGLRRQEALNLTWQNVHLDEKEPYIDIIKSKRDKSRAVPLVTEAIEALGDPKDVGPVFFQLSPDELSHRFKQTARDAKLPNTRLHDLRHTTGFLLGEAGVDLDVIAAILGHSNLSVTKIYRGRATVRRLAVDMAKLSRSKNGSQPNNN